MNLFQTAGEFIHDKLISGNKKGILTRGIELAPGQGILKRGTLLSRNEENLGVLFSRPNTDSAKTENDGNDSESATVPVSIPSGILTDEIDTGSETAGEPLIAEEYITGIFNPDAIITADEIDVKDYTEALRSLGIFLEEVK